MDTEQGTNPVHKTEPPATDATVGRTAAAAVPARPDPRVKGAALVFVLYPVAGLLIVGAYLLACGGSWQLALRRGARAWVYGVLVTSMACACFAGHVFLGDRVVAGGAAPQSASSRMFQLELATLSLCVGVAVAAFPDANAVEASIAATAWATFLGVAGLRHLAHGGPTAVGLADLATCAELLAVAWIGGHPSA